MIELEILLHVKHTRQSGENIQSITFVMFDQESVECYRGLERLKLGIHKGEVKIVSVMMMTMKTLLHLLTFSVQPDITVWKLFVHHVVL
jgi:hypothetical protein